jgi:predicted NBD/HSP70 family sugar kinase
VRFDAAEVLHRRSSNPAHRQALVRHLGAHPGGSRTELAAVLGVTKPTIGALVRQLISEGWLVENEVVASGDTGRPPKPLFVDPARLALIGAEVGVGELRVVATSLTGQVLARMRVTLDHAADPQAGLRALAAAMLETGGRLDDAEQRIIGIGVALPGRVDPARGFLHSAHNLGWRELPVAELLARRLAGTALGALPLFVHNEAGVAALGETEFNSREAGDPLLFVCVNHGVSAGLVVDGQLLVGSRGFAGEAGHIVLDPEGPLCGCGRRGCAEALISRSTNGGAYLGILLQNLVSAYDPACVVLSGSVVDGSGEAVLNDALQTLDQHLAAAHVSVPTVRRARFGEQAAAVGAAALARYRLASSTRVVRRLYLA